MKKIYTEYFTYSDFLNFDTFKLRIKELTNIENRYSLIFRICYSPARVDKQINKYLDHGGDWKSLGEQIALLYNDSKSYDLNIEVIYKSVLSRIEYSMELYDKKENDIYCFQLLIHNVSYTKNIEKKDNKKLDISLGNNRDLINVGDTTRQFKLLPLTTNFDKYGTKLNILFEDNIMYFIQNNEKKNVLDWINKYTQKKTDFISNNINVYENTDNNSILIINVVDNKNIIDIYSDTGIKLYHIEDTILDKDNFVRKIGSMNIYVKSNVISNKEIDINFEPIKKVSRTNKMQEKMIHPDWRVGTLDLETFKDIDNYSKIYAAGFYANDKCKTFYIDNKLNSDKVLLNCLDNMLTSPYHKYTFYVHNLGGYDIAFILKIIIDLNIKLPNTYKYKLIFRDEQILAINLSKKVNTKTYTIKLVDSYNMLNSSLKKLSESFDTEVKKTLFPYSFINRYNLFYKGIKPDIKYFNINTDMSKNYTYDNTYTIEDYNNIKNSWSTEKETIEYLKNDLISLYNVMDKFKNQIYIHYKSHITNSLTISSLAMDIYLSSFYDNNIPLINKRSVYNNIKNSYYGGITEVYKPYGKNLFYYDVNSLYPFCALNDMPGLDCVYVESINNNIKDLINDKTFFGFYYCEIKAPNKYIGLIPIRTNTGLMLPTGNIEGWYFSEELKFAYENGYKIVVKYGYKFSRSTNVFDKYVNEFFKIKSTTTNKTTKAMSKSLLNNLLGRFGLKIEGNRTSLVDIDEYNEILQTRKVKNVLFIGDKYLITYNNEVSREICINNNVDYEKALIKTMSNTNSNIFKQESYNNVSIAISSAVTAYARIYMNKVKLDILSRNGNIYYTDTDSIVTDIKLDDKLVGKNLGQFKLEHLVKEAYFITTKTYCLKDNNNNIIIRSKGVNKDLLKFEDYENLFKGNDVKTYRKEVIKDLSQGSVNINDKVPITLSPYAYTKRAKIFNKKGLWIDTKPFINNRNYTTSIHNKKIRKYMMKISLILFVLTGLIIALILAYVYVYSSLSINIDYILNDVLIDYNNSTSNVINKTYSFKINKSIDIPNFESIKPLNKNVTKEDLWNRYLTDSKIIRGVFIDHIKSISEETRIKDQKIKELMFDVNFLKEENDTLMGCINDISACIYKAKSPKL